MRSYYRCCCCINEPVISSHRVHLELERRFHALLKVGSDRDDIVPLKTPVDYILNNNTLSWYFNTLLLNPNSLSIVTEQ